jgi:DNA-binding transcriptional LysR family regulator
MSNISARNIEALDLNLLMVFHHIMAERSVTRAARRLGVSQPAVSHGLRKLRLLLEDELFVRSGSSLSPTLRAMTLADPIAAIVDIVEREVRPMTAFDPRASRREFALAMGDLAEVVFLPSLMRLLASDAPGCAIRTRRLPNDAIVGAMEAGDVELAIGNVPEMPGHAYRQTIFTHDYVALVAGNHPRLSGTAISWEEFAREEHIVVTSGSEIHLRELLTRLGVARKVALTVGGFLSAPSLLAGTEYVVVAPTRLAEDPGLAGDTRALRLPPPIEPFPLQSYWHPRSHSDPGHRWLREALFSVMSGYPAVG